MESGYNNIELLDAPIFPKCLYNHAHIKFNIGVYCWYILPLQLWLLYQLLAQIQVCVHLICYGTKSDNMYANTQLLQPEVTFIRKKWSIIKMVSSHNNIALLDAPIFPKHLYNHAHIKFNAAGTAIAIVTVISVTSTNPGVYAFVWNIKW